MVYTFLQLVFTASDNGYFSVSNVLGTDLCPVLFGLTVLKKQH